MFFRLLLVLVCVAGVCVAVSSQYTEHFNGPVPECNKLMANSPATQNTECEFVWRAPVFVSKGAIIPDANFLHFQDTAKGIVRTQSIRDIMQDTSNGLSVHCKTNPDISSRINKVVNRANQAVQNDQSLHLYGKLGLDAPRIPYLVDMRRKFERDLNEWNRQKEFSVHER